MMLLLPTMTMMTILHVATMCQCATLCQCAAPPMPLRGCELLRAIQLETPLLYTLLLLQYKDEDDEEEEEDDGDKVTLRHLKVPFW